MEHGAATFDYHRLYRSWSGYRWWKPLLTGLLGLAFYIFLIVLLFLAGIIVVLQGDEGLASYGDRLATVDLSDPLVFAFSMVLIILMIPALALAALITGPRPIGLLSSVHARIRWGWLGRCLVAAVAVYALSFGISFLLPPAFSGGTAGSGLSVDDRTALLVGMTLLLVPFQAAAEEYVFRGYLAQTIGSWLRHPAFAILIPVPFFVLGHGYDPLGQADVAFFAVFAGWITWRTGGLEAAIAAHAVNNCLIFLLGAYGLVDVNSQEGSATALVLSVATLAAFAAVVLRLSAGLERVRTTAPAPMKPPAPPAPLPAGHLP
ncbi:CPBP family intramembrane glutamic endopeptidase [Arthrobacter sp. H41]|uniref:CPBP family intramembrane glutamic endopeptidase n=1 Tax=Arthrobacter sp. H41 TaxID=1312978 RepID=UPI0004BBAEC5|nr:type II CAAX endopeptidase family protein [Arthrobacter sp. H41]